MRPRTTLHLGLLITFCIHAGYSLGVERPFSVPRNSEVYGPYKTVLNIHKQMDRQALYIQEAAQLYKSSVTKRSRRYWLTKVVKHKAARVFLQIQALESIKQHNDRFVNQVPDSAGLEKIQRIHRQLKGMRSMIAQVKLLSESQTAGANFSEDIMLDLLSRRLELIEQRLNLSEDIFDLVSGSNTDAKIDLLKDEYLVLVKVFQSLIRASGGA